MGSTLQRIHYGMHCSEKATWISWIELWKRCVEDDLELLHNKRISKEPITSTDQKKMQSGQLIMDSLALSFWNVVIVLPRVKFHTALFKEPYDKKGVGSDFICHFTASIYNKLYDNGWQAVIFYNLWLGKSFLMNSRTAID